MKEAAVISKRRGGEPEIHYLMGPQRETLQEAEDDLTLWNLLDQAPEDTIASVGPDEIETALQNLRKLLEGRDGFTVRAGRTAHRGPGGTRKGRIFIVVKIEDGEP